MDRQWIAPELPPPPQRDDDGVSFNLDEEYEQALGTATEEELVDLAGTLDIFLCLYFFSGPFLSPSDVLLKFPIELGTTLNLFFW